MEQKTHVVKLNDGTVINMKGTIDTSQITDLLNSQVMFVNLGGAIVQKHMILSILPLPEQPAE